ncbi:MAG: class I SAM-dependent methyltransferase [Acidimicrobiia bacterium]|nr:class I SAM-dependent methyltransferase [Acidimicrobiia bacterium]
MRSAPPLTVSGWLRYDLVHRHLERRRGWSSVLEVGAGMGAVGVRLAASAAYTGVEPDEASRAVATARVGSSGIVLADMAEVPAGRRFDVVCALEVLEHIEDDRDALQQWADRLAPGGELVISVPADPDRYGAADQLVGHHRRYSPERLVSLLGTVGLDDVEVMRYGFPLAFVLETVRNRVAARRLRNAAAPGPDRPAEEDRPSAMVERTAGSGRWFQPADALAPVTRIATAPFRALQWSVSDRGPWLLAFARRCGEA